MQSVISEGTLRCLASNLGKEWKSLATHLEVRGDEVDRIQADHHATEEQIFQMLMLWWQRWDRQRGGDSVALDALCKALTKSGRSDLITNIRGSLGPAEDLNANLCREELIRLYKKVMGKVPLLPWVSSDVSKIIDIFVELQLMENKNTATRVVRRKIGSYAEMLILEFDDDQHVTHILLCGVAGSGKTTIVSMIAYDWALQTSGSTLSKFRLLFTLNLQELKGTPDLIEAVYDQLLSEDTTVCREALRGYLKTHAEEVLVIMEGVDEVGPGGSQLSGDVVKIITGKILRGCTVIVTTRPHMVDTLTRMNPNFTRIESKGFSDEAVQQYIQRFFQDEDDERVASDLCRVIQEYDNLLDMVRLPIMLLIACLIWSEDQRLPDGLTEAFREAVFFILRRHFKKSGYPDSLNDEEFIERELKMLIQDLGKVALDGLMLPSQRLVFEPADFGNSAVVEKACQIGVLSQERVRSKLHAIQNVTFIHKTFQEAIAGFYLAHLAETDQACFNRYLSRVGSDEVHSLENVLRFCSGANVNAARILLRHVVSNAGVEGQEETFTLFLLMLLESRSAELHNTAAPLFAKNGLSFSFTCSAYQKSAFEFLVECASQFCGAEQSVFTSLKRLVLLDITTKDVACVNSILKHATNVSDIVLGFGEDGEVVGTETVLPLEGSLCEALLRMPLLETLSLFPSQGQTVRLDRQLDLSVVVGHLAMSDASSLQVLVFQSVSAGPRQRQMAYRKQAIPCKALSVLGMPFRKIRSLRCRDAIQGQVTERPPPRSLSELEAGYHRVEASVTAHSRSVPRLRVIQLLNGNKHADLDSVSSLISKAPNLQVVDLSRMEVCKAFQALAKPLSQLGDLKELLLSETGFSEEDAMLLTREVLPLMANLRILSLSHNKFASPEALLAVVRWSCNSKSLKALFLGGCVEMSQASDELSLVGDSDAEDKHKVEQSTETLTENSSVEFIDVQVNYLGEHTTRLIRLLKRMPGLKTINMSSMGLTDSDAVDLVGVLPACHQLQQLHLEGNVEIGNDGLEALLRVLSKLPDIQHLCVPFDDHLEGYSDMIRMCLNRRFVIPGCYVLRQREIENAIQIIQG